ncbi:MAG: hypothetical protein KIT22_02050 [Verrucomicrobiae bacterium]|nr:hypothetical protein [Verrucomicrobiae bacterium]
MSDAPKKRGPQWTNSYEAQLSDSDLLWLHTALLSRTPSDKAIRAKMPAWKSGPRTGQPVSLATLSNIRDRLEAEEAYHAAELAAESLVKERQEREPGISEAELEEYGQRVFTEITIHRQDLKGFVKLRSARNKAKLDQAKLALQQQAEARQREALALEQDRFRRDTCALFLKWAEDQRAKEIAQGSGTNAEKIEALGQLMFGGDWKTV